MEKHMLSDEVQRKLRDAFSVSIGAQFSGATFVAP